MEIDIVYRSVFLSLYSKLENSLMDEVNEKIEEFKNRNNYKKLKVHKLHGRLKGRFSFSVNYRYRIVFEYLDNKTVALMAIGDHDVYG